MAALRFNTYVFLFILLIIPLLSNSSGIIVESFKIDNILPTHSLHKGGVGMKVRKIMSFEHEVQDYDDPGPNPKHDPRKKHSPGGKP